MARIKNVKYKIYFLIYTKPRYAFEISDILYGRENKAVFAELKKLENENWIKDYTGEIEEKVTDGRSGYRRYYNASIEPIMKHIKKTYLLPPEGDQAVAINAMFRQLFNSHSFRYWNRIIFPKDFNVIPFDALDFILTHLDILYIICEQIKPLTDQFDEIKDLKTYYKAIDFLQKDKDFQSKLPEIANILYGEEDILEKIGDLEYMFVLPSVSDIRSYGFSSFGANYSWAMNDSQKISKLF